MQMLATLIITTAGSTGSGAHRHRISVTHLGRGERQQHQRVELSPCGACRTLKKGRLRQLGGSAPAPFGRAPIIIRDG